MKKLIAVQLLAISGILANTFDVASNFNAPDNPNTSSVFEYGIGGTPGTFSPLTSTTLNCYAAPTYCLDNGGSYPGISAVTWNGTGGLIGYASIVQPGNEVRMDPQATPGTILRFVAPGTGSYSVNGQFAGIDGVQHAVSVLLYHDAASLFSSSITSSGQTQSFSFNNLALNSGDTLDFIVISASDASYLSTGLAATITTSSSTPEPAMLPILLLALPVMLRARRRR